MRPRAAVILLGLALAACAPVSASTAPSVNPTAFIATRVVVLLTQNARPAATPSPGAIPFKLPTVTSAPIEPAAAPPTLQPTPTPQTSCGQAPTCILVPEHFWLERPAPWNAVNYPDRTYAYGATMDGKREPHHGVEFANPADTPVIAAAAGTVVVAGTDHTRAYGPAVDFYGNLVVVQLDQTYLNQPVYILHGHLKSLSVSEGQRVNVGDELGRVGATGVAIGAHLHFEVRVGANDYASSRNPELWLKPLLLNGQPQGAVAGRIVDTAGQPVSCYPLVLRPIQIDSDTPRSRYLTTYAADPRRLNGDDRLQENFAITDLPPGTYMVAVNTTTTYQQMITVTSGSLVWVSFTVNPPAPTPTLTPLP